jgi:hypothetical protein
MIVARNVCSSCLGDGKCAQCDGTGVNAHINEEEPKCRNCSGTGVCPVCNGTGGAILHQPEILDLGLNGK